MVMMVWFSVIYKQSIFSVILFAVLCYHTFVSQHNTERPLVLIRYVVVSIFVLEYAMALTCLSSYNSPASFPPQLLTWTTPNGTFTDYHVYPNE